MLVQGELLRKDRYLGNSDPIKRPSFDQLHSSFCADSYSNSSLLAILGYFLATLSLLSMLSKVRNSGIKSSGPTVIVSSAASMVVFLVSQWGFLKLGILPFYSDLYDKVTRSDNPTYEADSIGVTLVLLSPTIISACVLIVSGVIWFNQIAWGSVAFATIISVFSLFTEVISWFLMKGFAIPVTEIVSSITDAITAVLWVNRNNPPEHALKRLKESFFPDNSLALSSSNILKHIYRDHFDRRKLDVNDYGSLVLRKADSQKIRALIMIMCSICLLLAPFVVVALRAPALDAAVIIFQLLLISATYGIYIFTTDKTTTMKRLTAAV